MKSHPETPQIQSEPRPPFPSQKLPKPGIEDEMEPRPKYEAARYKPAGTLEGKIALVTGGDSGIGRAVAVLFAREGADVAIACLASEHVDASETKRAVEAEGRRRLTLTGDIAERAFCSSLVSQTLSAFGRLDILVSNAAHQNRKESIEEVTEEEFDRTFKTNVYAYFRLVKAALPHLRPGSSIIVTGSETGFEGPESEKVASFGATTALKRPAQPEELAPAYVFLASDPDSSFITGEILAVMGGGTAPG